uniref:IF rod domain-containing protein n=1 Tax=Mola mola TaxID=94237 RepID=A0A3Q3XP90_MOLML
MNQSGPGGGTGCIDKPVKMEKTYAYSVSGGAGGRGTKISTAAYGTRVGSSFGRGFDYQLPGATFGNVTIGNEKTKMQNLNDRLANYLGTVKNLERANSELEIKIREYIEKRGPKESRDYSKYTTTIEDLKTKILIMIKGNAQFAMSIDNARLASDDFRIKSYEMSIRQMVEADVARLRKLLDDTNVIRLHLESDIESLKEELLTLKRNHEKVRETMQKLFDVEELRQDLARIMEEMRTNYEKIALKNQEELKAWHECQITDVQIQVTESTTALKEATTLLSDTRRRYQALEIELQSNLSLRAALEASLHDIERRNNMELEKYNVIILKLQEELSKIHTTIQQKAQEYEQLLNIKVKLEAEIAEYRRLLDGGTELKLEDAADAKLITTQVVTVTQTLVDGKVVSESKNVKTQ